MKNNSAQTLLRQTAACDLKTYPYLCASLVSLPQKLQLLKRSFEASGIRYDLPNVQHSLDSDSHVINKLCEIEKVEKALQENALRAKIIKSSLDSLTKPDNQLLTDFYMNKVTCERLSQRFCQDRSSIYRKLNHALDRYILACYGVDKAA